MDDTRRILALRLVDDHGSIVIFEGQDLTNENEIFFAADHRPAQQIVQAIELEGEAVCQVPEYMILTSEESR